MREGQNHVTKPSDNHEITVPEISLDYAFVKKEDEDENLVILVIDVPGGAQELGGGEQPEVLGAGVVPAEGRVVADAADAVGRALGLELEEYVTKMSRGT